MREYAIMDVETSLLKHGERPQTKFWGYYDGKQYEKFAKTKDFLKFLKRQPPKTILHHANFDIIQLLMDGADLEILKSHNQRLIKCSIGDHFTMNTFSCFPISMKKIFNSFGYEKTVLSKLSKRNYDDCVLGLECCIKLDDIFKHLSGVSPLQKGTIASTGFAAAELVAGQIPKDLRFLEAYRGGRVEVFDTRPMQASKFDINSSYPTSFLCVPQSSRLLHLKVNCRDWFAPFFDCNNIEMLLFPNGVFSTYIYEDVLEKYILPNCKRTSFKILSKHKIDFSWMCGLKGYVQTIFDKKSEAKKQGNGGIETVCKLLLNAMYGRIGLKGESERARVLNYPIDGDDVITHYLGKNRWLCFDKVEREPRSNFSFAAYITDNARGRLYDSFVRNKAVYGDTDSCFTRNHKADFSGKIGTNLGEWDYLGRKPFHGINIKDYTFGDEEVRKGGSDFLTWTLKKFADGSAVKSTHRVRRQGLRKRTVLPNGETVPLLVK